MAIAFLRLVFWLLVFWLYEYFSHEYFWALSFLSWVFQVCLFCSTKFFGLGHFGFGFLTSNNLAVDTWGFQLFMILGSESFGMMGLLLLALIALGLWAFWPVVFCFGVGYFGAWFSRVGFMGHWFFGFVYFGLWYFRLEFCGFSCFGVDYLCLGLFRTVRVFALSNLELWSNWTQVFFRFWAFWQIFPVVQTQFFAINTGWITSMKSP